MLFYGSSTCRDTLSKTTAHAGTPHRLIVLSKIKLLCFFSENGYIKYKKSKIWLAILSKTHANDYKKEDAPNEASSLLLGLVHLIDVGAGHSVFVVLLIDEDIFLVGVDVTFL